MMMIMMASQILLKKVDYSRMKIVIGSGMLKELLMNLADMYGLILLRLRLDTGNHHIFPQYLMPGSQWGPRSITTCDFSYDAFNDSDGDKKTLGNYFTEGDPGQWNQFGDADECVVGHDVMLNSRYTNSPAGYADRWDRMHRYCSNPLDPKSNDTDGDGISDWDEIHQIQYPTRTFDNLQDGSLG